MLTDAQAFSSGQGFFPTGVLVQRSLEFLPSRLLKLGLKEKENINELTEIYLFQVQCDHIPPDNSRTN